MGVCTVQIGTGTQEVTMAVLKPESKKEPVRLAMVAHA